MAGLRWLALAGMASAAAFLGGEALAATDAKVAETARIAISEGTMRMIVAMVVIVFVGTLIAVMLRLSASPGWSLVDALSEEVEVTLTDAAGLPIRDAAGNIVKVTKPLASSSRLIALFGLMGILALFMGCGIALLYQVANGSDITKTAEAYANFLVYGAVLFAPYVVNKFSSVFEKFGPPRG
jgi:hypothetical protein